MENEQHSSSTNTMLIVIVLLILVGFGVWWFTMRGGAEAPQDSNDVNVEFQLAPEDSTE